MDAEKRCINANMNAEEQPAHHSIDVSDILCVEHVVHAQYWRFLYTKLELYNCCISYKH